jgi:hypothetical protein
MLESSTVRESWGGAQKQSIGAWTGEFSDLTEADEACHAQNYHSREGLVGQQRQI